MDEYFGSLTTLYNGVTLIMMESLPEILTEMAENDSYLDDEWRQSFDEILDEWEAHVVFGRQIVPPDDAAKIHAEISQALEYEEQAYDALWSWFAVSPLESVYDEFMTAFSSSLTQYEIAADMLRDNLVWLAIQGED